MGRGRAQPHRVIPVLRPGVEVKQVGANNPLIGEERELELTPASGPGAETSDLVAAILGWATVGVLVAVAVTALVLIVRGLIAQRDPRTPRPTTRPTSTSRPSRWP